ncbi:hypothetical protein STEG23_034950, partial [Scotinomys teguina]
MIERQTCIEMIRFYRSASKTYMDTVINTVRRKARQMLEEEATREQNNAAYRLDLYDLLNLLNQARTTCPRLDHLPKKWLKISKNDDDNNNKPPLSELQTQGWRVMYTRLPDLQTSKESSVFAYQLIVGALTLQTHTTTAGL